MNSKEKILEEFDKKFINDNYFYSTGNFNSIDPVVNKLKHFISDLIDQTREETIREVEENLPEEMIDNGGDVAFRGFNDCLDQIKQSLKSLINK